MLIVVAVVTIGCGNDDPAAPQVGTITINPEPHSINATWQMTGPNGFTNSADGYAVLADMTAGSYTLTWGAMADWMAPSPAVVTQVLAEGGAVTFAGTYIANPGLPAGFVPIPGGTFMMGSPTTEVGHGDYVDETQHQVTLTHSIFMQATEVTNQQYRDMAQWAYDNGYVTTDGSYLYDKLDGSTVILKRLGSDYYEMTFSAGVFSCTNPTHPVTWVTWWSSVAYCDWLSLQQGLPRAYNHSTWQCNGGNPYTAMGYRLPTEAEWEYACRAGTQTPFNTGACLDAGTEANCDGRFRYTECPLGAYASGTVSVGNYPANAFGLYDMHGNLWECCNDYWDTYGGTVTDPVGGAAHPYRVMRGGSWGDPAEVCRSAYRAGIGPFEAPSEYLGFRVARTSAP
jgi:formylglycine-generating enzyme required for sulfatase activity